MQNIRCNWILHFYKIVYSVHFWFMIIISFTAYIQSLDSMVKIENKSKTQLVQWKKNRLNATDVMFKITFFNLLSKAINTKNSQRKLRLFFVLTRNNNPNVNPFFLFNSTFLLGENTLLYEPEHHLLFWVLLFLTTLQTFFL